MRMPIKKLLSACAVLLLCGLLFVACDGPEAAKTPVKMTAVYIPEEDNIYGMLLTDWDFEVYLHWSDGTVEKTNKFEVVNQDRDLLPADSVKTYTLKSTEYDLTATVDIAIPAYQAFPGDRTAFCENLYTLMNENGITAYTMTYDKDDTGRITGATFSKPLNGRTSYWYFLEFSTFPNDPKANHFDRVKLETNNAIYDKAEMEQMKLLLITLTLPAETHLPADAYNLIQTNDGKLTAGNVEYLAFFNEKSDIVNGAMYYISADIVQTPCSAVDPVPVPTQPSESTGATEPTTPQPQDDGNSTTLLLIAVAGLCVIVIAVSVTVILVKKKRAKKTKEDAPSPAQPVEPAQPEPIRLPVKCPACGQEDAPMETVDVVIAGTPLKRTLCVRCAARFKP